MSAEDDELASPLRHIALEGATNFRDIGGYVAAGGRLVRWRSIYRSDSLSNITQADMQKVAGLGLRTVYDLRNGQERHAAPDQLPPGISIWASERSSQLAKVAELSQRIRHLGLAGELDRQVLEQWICDRYRLFPTEELDEYRRYFHRLLDGIHFPLLVHCASGKDRTGFAVASTLMALGVAREVILEDYLLSNRYRRSLAPLFPPNTSPETLAALSGVRASYLLAAFGAIDAAWGGDEAFLAQGLGLSSAHRRELQESILESA